MIKSKEFCHLPGKRKYPTNADGARDGIADADGVYFCTACHAWHLNPAPFNSVKRAVIFPEQGKGETRLIR